jgi:hypothetical protein
MGHGDATRDQECWHGAGVQREAIVKPDPVADDFAGKAVVLVARRVGRRGQAGESMARLRKDGQLVDNAIGLHQTAVPLLCLALVAICALFTDEQGGKGSIGMNFAMKVLLL